MSMHMLLVAYLCAWQGSIIVYSPQRLCEIVMCEQNESGIHNVQAPTSDVSKQFMYKSIKDLQTKEINHGSSVKTLQGIFNTVISNVH